MLGERFPELAFPAVGLRVKAENKVFYIFDPIRKKEVILTPEEWVRQHVIGYFCEHLNYPLSMAKVESGQGMTRGRFDVLWYGRDLNPFLLIECKSALEKIDGSVVQQAGNYAKQQKSPYLFLSNGLQHVCVKVGNESKVLKEIPQYGLEG